MDDIATAKIVWRAERSTPVVTSASMALIAQWRIEIIVAPCFVCGGLGRDVLRSDVELKASVCEIVTLGRCSPQSHLRNRTLCMTLAKAHTKDVIESSSSPASIIRLQLNTVS